jgi:hypothetical protein
MALVLKEIPLDKFPAGARRFVQPDAPAQMKRMVADAMVPMKPVIQVCSLYQFAVGDDEDLARRATQSLLKAPIPTLLEVVKKPLLPQVLHWVCVSLKGSREIVHTIITNPKTPIDTLIEMARGADEDICDVIARNQIRLVQSSSLVETLFLNANMRASSVDRMLDFAAHSNMNLDNIPGYNEIIEDIQGRTPQTAAAEAAADEAFRVSMDEALQENEADASVTDRPVAAGSYANEDTEAETTTGSRSAAGRIRELNIAQKVRLAMMGSATDRAILIKDTNKVVARTVIRSPGLSDSEVLKFSKNKALLDEVISYIATNKKWTRHYQIKKNLVGNPKTPISQTMKFLTHLRTQDLRLIARSKDIPGPVAKAANQLVKKRLER